MAQLMTVLLALHLMQVIIDGAYKAPREVNFWFGLILLILVLALSLTGYLLPWDQKGYWATKVTTNIAGITPVIGPMLQKLMVGGSDYGHHTLSRFFALHAGVLPGMIVVLLVGHIALFRKHGITAKKPYRKPDAKFWPDQVLMDGVACLSVLATVLFFIVAPRLSNPSAALGAELGAPADPSEAFSAARPEWYFLFLFQFLKYFPGETEIWGAIVVPNLVLGLIFLMPFFGKWKLGHRFNIGFVCALLAGAGLLTYLAIAQDKADPNYQLAVKQSQAVAQRAKELARKGIPQTGALGMVRSDPYLQGPVLFSKHCASCHRYGGHDGLGFVSSEPQSASDLKGFGSREWLSGLLDPAEVDSTNYYGGTKFKEGKMVRFVKRDIAKFSAGEKVDLQKIIVALSAEAGLPKQESLDENDRERVEEGKKLMGSEMMRCTECHQFGKADEDATAPDLTGYGSKAWLISFLNDPAHDRFYGKRNDRMPSYGKENILEESSIGILADWLREDWIETDQVSIKH
ncbi:MAG: cytochrome b N-terminal domain-containing protein, partial [Verrucomicrobiota bacterium]|nr:cytochrome b N-terminal domain-containing protein [Verrucomicrobiota bacterium]